MAGEATRSLLGQVETLFRAGATAGLSDDRLLERFAARSNADEVAEAAFATLVERHGSMVLRACRRILADEHAAEDAAQATFLVLARRAGSIRNRESVAGWLHGVALRVAAKEHVARARRRVRERRGGTIAAERITERTNGGMSELGEWLDQELGRLPEAFRTPLVLCYLEGATQEQAAARLGWPIGTLQSRLARGKAKLKASLLKRGLAPTLGLLAAEAVASSAQAAPASWVEATCAAALAFTQQGDWAVKAGARPAAAGLAWEVLRDMRLIKLKGTLAAALLATTATIVFASLQTEPGAAPPQTQSKAETPKPKAILEVLRKSAALPSEVTVHGKVRDESGKPLAKVWVGGGIRGGDEWQLPLREDIRERTEPFRNARGEIIPPGLLGKYFEYRTRFKIWAPLSHEDIGPVPPEMARVFPHERDAKPRSAYAVRVSKRQWWMYPLSTFRHPGRTDSNGTFTIKVRTDGESFPKLFFASPNFELQEMRVLERDDLLGRPLNIVLHPARLIRGHVFELPKNNRQAAITWSVSTVEPSGKVGQEWQDSSVSVNYAEGGSRYFEVRLPAGKYAFDFRSPTLHRRVALDVFTGDDLMDVDFRLESLASIRSIGKPAMEIEANDLDGLPVKLADFRGKVVVLHFWATWSQFNPSKYYRAPVSFRTLWDLGKRFLGKPLVMLGLHDSTVASADEYRRAVSRTYGSLPNSIVNEKNIPFRVLIDRPQIGKGTRPDVQKPGDKGAGRSAETYEVVDWPSTFVIAPDGTMLGRFDQESLEGILEDQFGLPHSRPKDQQETTETRGPKIRRNVRIRGKVVGPDDRPVAGASVTPQEFSGKPQTIRTSVDGGFEFTAEEVRNDRVWVRVEAPDLASKMFCLETDGVDVPPLKLGNGVVVTGRLLHEGNPLAGVPIRLYHVDLTMERYLPLVTSETDTEGRFRFTHVSDACKFEVASAPGSLKGRNSVEPLPFETGADGATVELGDLATRPGRTLAGRVILADDRAIPPGTTVIVSTEIAPGVVSPVNERGRFEVPGLLGTEVSLAVRFPGSRSGFTEGYRLSAKNRCLDPINPFQLEGRLDRDIEDLTILLEPGSISEPTRDQGLIADFRDAKAGTITGVPPVK